MLVAVGAGAVPTTAAIPVPATTEPSPPAPLLEDFLDAASTIDAHDAFAAILGASGSTPELAVAMVASAFGPVDGVASAPDLGYPTGALAYRMVRRHWAELDDAEQRAVAQMLGPIDDEAGEAATARRARPVGLRRTAPVSREIDLIIDAIADEQATRMGVGSLADRIVACVGPYDRWGEGNAVSALPVTADPPASSGPNCGYAGAMAGSFGRCLVAVRESVFDALDPDEQRGSLAAAVQSCYQWSINSSAGGRDTDWVWAGVTQWVAAREAPSLATDAWSEYLLPEASIFERAWDAIGYWTQLDELDGVDLWSQLAALYRHDTAQEFLDAVRAIGGDQFMRRISTHRLNDSGLGPRWGMAGAPPIIIVAESLVPTAEAGNRLDRLMPLLFELRLTDARATLRISGAIGTVATKVGGRVVDPRFFDGSASYDLCAGIGCRCADRRGDAEADVIDLSDPDASLLLGVTATSPDARLWFDSSTALWTPEEAICAELHEETIYLGDCGGLTTPASSPPPGHPEDLPWCSEIHEATSDSQDPATERVYALRSADAVGGTDVCVLFDVFQAADGSWEVASSKDCYGLLDRRFARAPTGQPTQPVRASGEVEFENGRHGSFSWDGFAEQCRAPACLLYFPRPQADPIEVRGGGPWQGTWFVVFAGVGGYAPKLDAAIERCQRAAALSESPYAFGGYETSTIGIELEVSGWLRFDDFIRMTDGADWTLEGSAYGFQSTRATETATWSIVGPNPGDGCPSVVDTTVHGSRYTA